MDNFQQANQAWWEEHSMTYNWKEKDPENYKIFGYISRMRYGTSYPVPYSQIVDERVREGHWFAQGKKEPLFKNLIPYASLSGKRVLEIGCGLGSIAAQLARSGAHVTALDISEKAVSFVQDRLKKEELPGEILQGNAEQLPFSDNRFDYAWSWGVLHHTPDTKTAISEIRRVLKPGGTIAMMIYNRNSLRNWFRVYFLRGILQGKFLKFSREELENRYSDGVIAKHYTPTGAKQLLFAFQNVKLSIYGQRSEILPGIHRLPSWITFPVEPIIRKLLRQWGWFLFVTGSK